MRFAAEIIYLAAASAFAQEPAPIKVSTHLIQVDVIVRNGGGPVTDLTKEDFVVLDKGKQRNISVFAVSGKPAGTGTTVRMEPLPAGVVTNRLDQQQSMASNVTVILFDTLNTKFTDQIHAREHVLKVLRQIRPRDRTALYVLGDKLRVLEDYTDDHRSVLSRAESPSFPWDLLAYHTTEMSYIEKRKLTLSALEQISNHVTRIPGRKNLVWISASFPFNLIGMGAEGPQTSRREGADFAEDVERAVRSVSAANLALYPVDARGLIGSTTSAVRRGSGSGGRMDPIPGGQNTMRDLADRTGGIAFINTNDLSGAIGKAIEDADVSYTLGFYPDADELDGKFHDIKVKVGRRGVDVRFRRGYIAGSPKTPSPEQLKRTLADAVGAPFEMTGIGMSGRVDALPNSDSRQAVTVAQIQDLLLARTGDRWNGEIDIAVAQFNKEGELLDFNHDVAALSLTDQSQRAMSKSGMEIRKTFTNTPNSSYFRILVMDRVTGAIGSLRIAAQISE